MKRVGKALYFAALVGLSLGLTACEEDDEPDGPVRARTAYTTDEGERVYFSFRDPTYDDRGPGRYTYPLIVERAKQKATVYRADGTAEDTANQAFNMDTRTGLFDITNFRVVSSGPNVVFEISTARPIPKYRDDQSSGAQGWFLQLMDLYIDKDHAPGSGRTRTLPGRCVEFPPESAWDQMILVTPQVAWDVRRAIDQVTSDLDFVRMKSDIYIPNQVFVEGYTFRVFVPKSVIGEPQPGWGYQCFMMLFNPTNVEYGHFQQGKVKRFAGNNVFGGADEYNGHPNVIDLLAPTPEDQYRVLSDYVSSPSAADNRYAIAPMIYADPPRTRPVAAAPRRPDVNGPPPHRPPASRGMVARAPAQEVEPEAREMFSNPARVPIRPATRSRSLPAPPSRRGYQVDRFDVGEGE